MPGAWDDEATADAYARFCERHRMYADTSADLVRLAAIDGDTTVIDLACGTGQTTQAVLAVLGSGGIIHAVDGSPAMLAEARRRITDPRVHWHHRPAETLADVATAGTVDAVVCNSAIWQTPMAETFAAAKRALRPGGTCVFNIGRQFLVMPFTEEELQPTAPSLHDIAQAIAVLDHDHVASGPRRGGRPLTVESVASLLDEAGLVLERTEELRYNDTVDRQLGWLSIPIFGRQFLPGLADDVRGDVLQRAAARVKGEPPPARWMAVVARRPAGPQA